jgi:hypothetical protein
MVHGQHINDEDEMKHVKKESIGYRHKSNLFGHESAWLDITTEAWIHLSAMQGHTLHIWSCVIYPNLCS